MGHTVVGRLLLGHTVRGKGLGGADRSLSGQRRLTRQPVIGSDPTQDLKPLSVAYRPGGGSSTGMAGRDPTELG